MSAVRLGLIMCIVALAAVASHAHPLTFTETTLALRSDGTFQVDIICDLDALALGRPQDTDDAELVAALRTLTPEEFASRTERLRELFRRRVRVRFDDQPAPFAVDFPDYGTPRATESAIPTVLGLTARLTGIVPPGATTVDFFASRSFADVHLTVVDDALQTRRRSVLERGARSDPFELVGPVTPDRPSQVAAQYLRLGFIHIVPEGADHILFVLGLFLLSPRLKPLLWQVTAFTVAHAVTLTLGALDIVTAPAHIVEPIIALSIVWIAVENLFTTRLTAWRPMVVFGFGLLHGLGFAGVLRQLGLPAEERVLGLLTFNVGIELGQLAVLVGAWFTIGWFRRKPYYRTRIVMPLSGGIALVGLVWTVGRTLG